MFFPAEIFLEGLWKESKCSTTGVHGWKENINSIGDCAQFSQQLKMKKISQHFNVLWHQTHQSGTRPDYLGLTMEKKNHNLAVKICFMDGTCTSTARHLSIFLFFFFTARFSPAWLQYKSQLPALDTNPYRFNDTENTWRENICLLKSGFKPAYIGLF